MDNHEVKKLLNMCERYERRSEDNSELYITWTFMGVEVAGAYDGQYGRSVWVDPFDQDEDTREHLISFNNADVEAFLDCGDLVSVEHGDILDPSGP